MPNTLNVERLVCTVKNVNVRAEKHMNGDDIEYHPAMDLSLEVINREGPNWPKIIGAAHGNQKEAAGFLADAAKRCGQLAFLAEYEDHTVHIAPGNGSDQMFGSDVTEAVQLSGVKVNKFSASWDAKSGETILGFRVQAAGNGDLFAPAIDLQNLDVEVTIVPSKKTSKK